MAPSTLQIPNPRQPACTSFLIAPVVADYTADVLSIKNGLRKNDLKKRGVSPPSAEGARDDGERARVCVCLSVGRCFAAVTAFCAAECWARCTGRRRCATKVRKRGRVIAPDKFKGHG